MLSRDSSRNVILPAMTETEQKAERISSRRWVAAAPRAAIELLGRISLFKTLPLSWTLGQDSRRQCKRLQLEGWELWTQLDEGADRGRPLRVTVARTPDWPLAVWAMAFYRGPVTLVWPSTGGEVSQRFRVDLGGPSHERVEIEANLENGTVQDDGANLWISARRHGKQINIQVESR